MSDLTDNLHMTAVRIIVPVFDDLPREAQKAIEEASDAVVDAVTTVVKWVFD